MPTKTVIFAIFLEICNAFKELLPKVTFFYNRCSYFFYNFAANFMPKSGYAS